MRTLGLINLFGYNIKNKTSVFSNFDLLKSKRKKINLFPVDVGN